MTTNENGAREIALPSVTELVLSSGVVVWIRPASLNDQRLIHEEMSKRFPLPREADYKIPVPEDQATIPGQTMTDTEAFRQALGSVGKQQQAYWLRSHILTCLDFPEGTDAILERYQSEIARKRKFLSLPEDDLEAVIYHSIIRTPDDEKRIASVINETMPVEMSEVVSQLRIFRPVDQSRPDHALHQRRKKTPVSDVDTRENGVARNEPAL